MIPAPAKLALDFIASFEAPRGYDTVYGNKMSRMAKPITSMTVDEAIENGPWRTKNFGSSACGRYQFMTATLKGLRDEGKVSGRALMSPTTQDELGYALLLRRGYAKFMAGKMSVTDFGNQIAMEWASFPVLSSKETNRKDGAGNLIRVRRGQSYYAGDGQNHVLAGAAPVEAMLARMLSGSTGPAVVPVAPPVSAPRAPTVAADVVPRPWWQRLLGLGPKPIAEKSRPGLKGDPALWDVQAALKDRGYYNTGLLDGLDGSKTQAAVAQIRKDNGLGDGGIDAQFLAGLPTWPHARISTERATMSITAAAEHRPELFSPPAWLATVGTGLLGLGGATGSGLTDAIGKANDVAGQVQTVFGVVSSAVGFVVEHRTFFLILAGLFLLWKGVSALLGAWIKVRQAFF